MEAWGRYEVNGPDRRRTFWQARLLIVDDEIFVRRLVRRMMSALPFAQIEEADDGARALRKLKELKPDLIISDVNMEPMNGLELLKQIRTGRAEVRRDVPVILLTGETDQSVLGHAVALDANAFLPKPIGPGPLGERVQRCFDDPIVVKDIAVYEKITVTEEVAQVAEPKFDAGTMISKDVKDVQVGDILGLNLRGMTGGILIGAGTEIGKASLGTLRDLVEMGQIEDVAIMK